jgi:flagellar hook-length control protein FliK
LKSLSSEKIQEENANFQLKIDHLQILQEIGQKIVWSFKNNEGRIRFLVEPPELGNIYMEIKKDKGNIQVTLWAENTITKEILETNQIQLYRMLKGDGFTLDKFDVFVQQDMKDFQDWEKNFVHYDRKSSDGLEERPTAPGEYLEADSHPLLNLFHRGNQYVDLFV